MTDCERPNGKTRFYDSLQKWKEVITAVPDTDAGAYLKVLSIITLSQYLHEFESGKKNPYPELTEAMDIQTRYMELFLGFSVFKNSNVNRAIDQTLTANHLYETAWTSYSDATYDHSLSLAHKRLKANNINESFLTGKRVIDVGCGTGRFAIALAQLGASESIGIDIGTKSILFAEKQKKRFGISNVYFHEMAAADIQFPDGSFDLIISNGVLHHIDNTEGGITEHLRILKEGGTFWLYLYGKNALVWEIYDTFKDVIQKIPYHQAMEISNRFGLIEEKFYLFSDNVYTPIRKYFSYADVEKMLSCCCEYEYDILNGATGDDDVTGLLSQPYGKVFWGEEGEVRMKIKKIRSKGIPSKGC